MQSRARRQAGRSAEDLRQEAGGFVADICELRAVFAGVETGAGAGGHRAGRKDAHIGAGALALGLPAAGKSDLGGLGRAVMAEIGLAAARIVEELR